VQLWAPHDGHERHRRRPQLLRVVLHGRPTRGRGEATGRVALLWIWAAPRRR
jgi:hypothetical protein